MEEGHTGSEKFEPKVLGQISSFTAKQLTDLESAISTEFKSISKDYIQARLDRANNIIEKINKSLKSANANDKNWLKIYNFEIETINNIKNNTEDLILSSEGLVPNRADILRSFDEYEEELKEIFKNLQSPLDFDKILKDQSETNEDSVLPFPYLFQQFFKPHKSNLEAIINEKNYQTNLIQNTSVGNSTIIWKQYYNNLVREKQKLVQETYDDLNKLYKEYHNINEEEMSVESMKHYYRSVVGVNEIKKVYIDEKLVNTSNSRDLKSITANDQDSGYLNPDNQYVKNNKIENTNTRKTILKSLKRFSESQLAPSDDLSKRTKLDICKGLENDEIDMDLLNLRNGLLAQAAGVESSIVGQNECENDAADDEDEVDDISVDSEKEEEEDPASIEGEAEHCIIEVHNDMKSKYDRLLALDKPVAERPYSSATHTDQPFQLPALPPIGQFHFQ